MFPLMPCTIHTESKLELQFLGGAVDPNRKASYQFSSFSRPEGTPRSRHLVAAVSRRAYSSTGWAKLDGALVNGIPAEIYKSPIAALGHEASFIVAPLHSASVSIALSFSAECAAVYIGAWVIDGLDSATPTHMFGENTTSTAKGIYLDVTTPPGGVSLFCSARGEGTTATTVLGGALEVYQAVKVAGPWSSYFAQVDNADGVTPINGNFSGQYVASVQTGGFHSLTFSPPEPPFSPAQLFTGGKQGVWYDPSDLDSMFQDAAGTIPAAYGQPVGLILDKSGNSNHASQATATARPTLGRMPVGGVRNLLRWTEDFSNAVWLKSSVTTEEVVGLPGAFKLTPVAANAPHNLRAARVPSSDPHVASLEVRAAGYSKISLFNSYGSWSGTKGAVFDIATGTVIAGSNQFATIQPLSDGWYRITTPVTATVVDLAIAILDDAYDISSSPYTYSFAANGVSGIDIRHPQLERGDSATPYQRVGASHYDVTEAGVQSLSYLEFDGVDDVLRRPWTLGWAAPAEVHWLGQSNGTSGAGIGGLGIQYQQTATRFGTLVAPNWIFGVPTATNRESLTTSDGNMSAVAVRGGSATDDLMVAYRDGLVLGSRVPGVALGTAQSGNLQIGDAAYQSHFYGGVMIFRELTSAEREQLVDYFQGAST